MIDDNDSATVPIGDMRGSVTIGQPSLHLCGRDGRAALIIHPDGRIEIGDGFTPTEAGEEAIEAIRGYLVAAVLDTEREECAKIAEGALMEAHSADEQRVIDDIAAQIRARKGKP